MRVTAGFTGTLRVRKVVPNGDVTSRIDPPFNTGNVGATPLPLVSGVVRVVSFTIAAGQGGNHVIEIDGDLEGDRFDLMHRLAEELLSNPVIENYEMRVEQ